MPTHSTTRGLAVLPRFENRSSDPEQEFLADGIVEDSITRHAWSSAC